MAYGVPLVVAGKTEDKVEVTARVAWSDAVVGRQIAEAAGVAGLERIIAGLVGGDPHPH